jgi:septal ring factor EnvC (AmiA/AmiB activator)
MPDEVDKMMDQQEDEGSNQHADLEPDGLGQLKSIKRLPGMKKHAPPIAWGDEYKKWPIEKRLKYAEKLASAMNHAADILQTERNGLVKIAKAQEEKLKLNQKQYLEQGDFFHQQVQQHNTEKQQLYQQIVTLTSENNKLKKRVAQLERRIDTPPEPGETVKA